MTLDPGLFESTDHTPLAARLRPSEIAMVVGQQHLLGPDKPLRLAIERGEPISMVLWGPPGVGKTTIARLVAKYTDAHFEPFSAVTDGVPRVRELIRDATDRRRLEGRATILFCDEIHRFNKAQQDAFLPSVEDGTVALIGATTENPSFALNAALLSRVPVYVLETLDASEMAQIIDRGFTELGAGDLPEQCSDEVYQHLVRFANGDARRGLNAVQLLVDFLQRSSTSITALSVSVLEGVLAKRLPRYDKSGDQHYDIISALHKSVRGSDVNASLYWLARMIEGGEDGLYIARRLVRMASEDIGLADPRALTVALAAKETYAFLGSPEGELALAEATIYLASSPKSNRVYSAWALAQQAANDTQAEEVPKHLRNAPTKLLRELGHGRDYKYDPEESHGFAADQTYLPERLGAVSWYEPTDLGYERTIRERLQWWEEQRRGAVDTEGG